MTRTVADRDIAALQPLVAGMVRRKFRNAPRWVEFDDLTQAGLLAIVKRAPDWKPELMAWVPWALSTAYHAIQDYMRAERFGPRKQEDTSPWEVVSMNQPVMSVEGENVELGDTIAAPEVRTDPFDMVILDEMLNELLDARERHVLEALVSHGRTLAQVGAELHLTESRISQIASGARRKMRADVRGQALLLDA